MLDLTAARAFLAMLGDPDGVYDFRAIHDVRRDVPAQPFRGTLNECGLALDQWNAGGYGIFVVINELDGTGREVSNVRSIRAQFADIDSDPDWIKYRAMMNWEYAPSFCVVSSPNKFHAYWTVKPYLDLGRFETIQRKLVTLWGGDPAVIDAPRVMRLPGSAHMKDPAHPTLVTMVPGSGLVHDVGALEWALVNVAASGGSADRKPLGDNTVAVAPSLEWAKYALSRIDPDTLGRDEWLAVTSAFKASAWQWGDDTIRPIWDTWCARYTKNDIGENTKLWKSIASTKTGWKYLSRVAGIEGDLLFGTSVPILPGMTVTNGSVHQAVPSSETVLASPTLLTGSSMLTPAEQVNYFAGCVLIESMGEILTPSGRFMGPTKFNASYGGKQFVYDAMGKATDEAWRAATRGQVFQVPKVDHLRFLPTSGVGALILDELGRAGINTYIPPKIEYREGDPSPFIKHIQAMLPDLRDAEIYFNYLRHCVQRPGVKAFWAPLIQSMEGAGKGIIKEAMTYACGSVYVASPNIQELTEGGGKFNAWMRNKTLIIADEIRVDDKRDMLEVLKPMITEARIEIQAKGVDQQMEDNVSNWIMFTNWKDAIPITSSGRRYSIFYSTLQSMDDLAARGMDGDYFPRLYGWLREDGRKHVAHWLRTTPIVPEFDPMGAAHRAPVTSSTAEAILASMGRVEQAIMAAVDEGRQGFRGGWLSSIMVGKLLKEDGLKYSPHGVKRAYENLGYNYIGRSKILPNEEYRQSHIYAKDKIAHLANYEQDQGYLG